MTQERILRVAEFDSRVCQYWLISGSLICLFSIVGIPLLLLWLPLGMYFSRRYLKSVQCVLTHKALKVKKGVLVKTEKTIPLEKITDTGTRQGPIMRAMGLQTLTVETAGQSSTGALVTLTGIIDTEGFREAVLAQRDRDAQNGSEPVSETTGATEPSSHSNAELKELLTEIRDVLQRIEQQGKQKQDR